MRNTAGPGAVVRTDSRGQEFALYFNGDSNPTERRKREPAPEPELPSPDILHGVYNALLGALELSSAHFANLSARGLSTEEIQARGYRSKPSYTPKQLIERVASANPNVDLATVPGFWRSGTTIKFGGDPGIVVPVRDAEGRIVALKIRRDTVTDGDARYRWVSSRSHDGPSPGSPCHVPVFHTEHEIVRVTEGELKADVSTALSGTLTIGIPGATCGAHALPILKSLGASTVILAWDADKRRIREGKPNWVALGLQDAALRYRQAGLEVAIEDWSAELGKGIDDVLAANRYDDVQVFTGAAAWQHVVEIVRMTGGQVRSEVLELAGEPVESTSSSDASPPNVDWKRSLTRTKGRGIASTFGNICAVLRYSPEYGGRIEFDEMSLRPCLDGKPLSDAMIGHIREDIERIYRFAPAAENLAAALLTVGSERSFHPVARFLDSLPKWDGKERIVDIPDKILGLDPGAPETAFAYTLVRKWMIACVARVRRPGCKVDTALVLRGDQGRKKSSFFAAMAGEFFVDCDMDLEDKDAVLQMRAGWVVEWGEIERVTSRKHADVVKAFVSRATDVIRAPYARAVQPYPRESVIVGSTNKPDFLIDETGDRRFWVIDTGSHRVAVEALLPMRPQLWAEAVAAFEAGEQWWFETVKEQRTHAELTKAYRKVDLWHPIVADWLLRNSPPWTDATTILRDALNIRPQDMRDEHATKIGRIMSALDWERRKAPRAEDPKRPWRYYRMVLGPDDPVPDPNHQKTQAGPSGPSGPSTFPRARAGAGANENGNGHGGGVSSSARSDVSGTTGTTEEIMRRSQNFEQPGPGETNRDHWDQQIEEEHGDAWEPDEVHT